MPPVSAAGSATASTLPFSGQRRCPYSLEDLSCSNTPIPHRSSPLPAMPRGATATVTGNATLFEPPDNKRQTQRGTTTISPAIHPGG